LTVAVTPSSLFSFFSMRAAQEAQVIPPMVSSTSVAAPGSVVVCVMAFASIGSVF